MRKLSKYIEYIEDILLLSMIPVALMAVWGGAIWYKILITQIILKVVIRWIRDFVYMGEWL